MWRHDLLRQARLRRPHCGDCAPDDMRRSKPGQRLSMWALEYGASAIAAETKLGDQNPQGTNEIGRDRHDTFLASLATKKHLGSGPVELEIADIYAQRFGYSGARATEKQQQGPIATPAWGLLVGRGNQRIQFIACKVMGDLNVCSLDRDGEDPVGDSERCGIAGADVLEEGPDRSESRIARLDRVRPRRLQII